MRDDGIVLFLNGTEIWRDNLPADGVTSSTPALAPAPATVRTNFLTKPLNPALLVDGSNVLAAEIHQAAPDGPDVRFDFELASVALVPAETSLGILPISNGALLVWPADAGLYHLYATTNLCPGTTWIRTTHDPVLSNGFWVVTLPLNTNQAQFYRLQTP